MKKQIILSLFFLLANLFLKAQTFQPTAQHPEKGILPFNAPCTDCIEELEKRSGNTREFFKKNSDGSKTIYKQQSLGNINFKDEKGYWRTIDPQLKEETKNVFAARQQPSPVVIDLENKISSITNGGKEFRFNKNISLVHVSAAGVETNFGAGDWTHVSKTQNYTETIILVQEFYPGVDLQLIASSGKVETNFILKNKMRFADGWLTMNQQIEIPDGLQTDLSGTTLMDEKLRMGTVDITNTNHTNYFSFKRSFARDAHEESANYVEMPFWINNNQLNYFVPVSWLNNSSTKYPVVLDPFVYSSDTLMQAAILGSGYTAVCGTLGCSYFMNNVMTPPNCTITGISCYFAYIASLPCVRPDGGFDITMTSSIDSCTTRNFTCLGAIQGGCFFYPAELLNAVPPITACVLPPQCTPYPVDFELRFHRCNWLNQTGCDNTCISSNSDWIMSIEGRTVEATSVSLPATICQGNCIDISVTAAWGVPPYTFTWQPGALVGSPVNVCPTTSTDYLGTVTDACGLIDTFSTGITVQNCTGITENAQNIFSIHPNPASTELTVEFNSGDQSSKNIFVYDVLGRERFALRDLKEKRAQLDVGTFSKGIYFVKVMKDEKQFLQKLVVE